MKEEKLTILGSGTMGHSIALTAALSGLSVKVWGNTEQDIANGARGVREKLQILLQNEAITEEEKNKTGERIQFSINWEDALEGATFIIEAIPEILQLKQDFFQKLDQQCPSDVILASNTSGLSPTAIAINTKNPGRTIVTHFWNPAHLIPLVEVVRGEKTTDQTVDRAMAMIKKMNKKPILVKKDILGSIGNRLQYALFREAQYILEQGVASMEDIDDAVRYSLGRRLPVTGPFMTADMGGLDVFHAISSYLFPDLCKEDGSLASMRQLVDQGKYGQKNGAGFYHWTPEFSAKMSEAREKELIEWLKKDRASEGW